MAIQSPNYTQYPNEIIDTWMCKLSGAEFKILTAICRKTFGWSKDRDLISISQISELTGLGKTQIIKAVKSLEAHDLIVCERRDKQTTAYSVKVDDVHKVNKTCSESEQDRVETCSQSEHTKETKLKKIERKTFVPPSSQEVQAYLDSKNITEFSGDEFCASYEAKGWKIGNNKMVNWKAAVATWYFRDKRINAPKKMWKEMA